MKRFVVLAVVVALPALAAQAKTAAKAAPAAKKKAVSAQKAPAPKLSSEEARIFYALGVTMGQSLLFQVNPSREELDVYIAGFMDGALQHEPRIKVEDFRSKIQTLGVARVAQVAEAEKKASEGFLEKMAAQEGAVKTDSGMIFFDEKPGDGAAPSDADVVKVNYRGTLRDGTVFDSSFDRDEPLSFRLNAVIPCWREGVGRMKVRGKAKFVCPPNLAYGDRGQPPKIKPGSTLVFEVELLEIIPAGTVPGTHPGELPPGHPE